MNATVALFLMSIVSAWALFMGIFNKRVPDYQLLATSTVATFLYTLAVIALAEIYRAWLRRQTDVRELINEIRSLKEVIQQLKGDKPDEHA